MIRRRRVLHLGVACTALLALSGHTPYRHWQVYRQKHLLIGSSKADPASYAFARRIAETLARQLPESRARASRAPDERRVASLLASSQWQVAVLRRDDAGALAAGSGRFETTGPQALRALFTMGEHLLVSRADFPSRHAWLVVATLAEHAASIPGGAAATASGLPIALHPGARAYASGAPPPAAPEAPQLE